MKRNIIEDLNKLSKVLNSCVTEKHLEAFERMLKNYLDLLESQYNTVVLEVLKNHVIFPFLRVSLKKSELIKTLKHEGKINKDLHILSSCR